MPPAVRPLMSDAASFVDPLYESSGSAVVSWLRDLFNGDVERTIPSELVGGPPALVFVAAAALFVVLAVRNGRDPVTGPGPDPAPRA